ncbi:MAG: hypothetical protein COB02_12360 [Candidatus Cloacimonadota bacterium]|nr:MAG: hypothetical protein COB02_12360 [Candidatus Cloacimonadota bacterium]
MNCNEKDKIVYKIQIVLSSDHPKEIKIEKLKALAQGIRFTPDLLNFTEDYLKEILIELESIQK